MAARPYRIGVLGIHTNIDYPRALFLGIHDMVLEAGHILISIDDLIPYHDHEYGSAYLKVATAIASRLDLDVLVFPFGSMVAKLRCDADMAFELLSLLDPKRTLVVERELAGYRCITKDDAPGMHACMRHLIEDLGLRRIAFISGPEKSRGAREREAIYFEEMAAHGLETGPELFARGDFAGYCADNIERILDANPDLQAICCACDLIAYTVYRVCKQRNLVIGKDIAVTGFDDHPRSSHIDPPLSTVHLTAYDYGCMTGREALRMCEGMPQVENVLTSSFVARNSCGESVRNELEDYRKLLHARPYALDTIVSIMLDATLTMASSRDREHFRSCLEAFVTKVSNAYRAHLEAPTASDQLISYDDLVDLFGQGYRDDLSLEGFHTAVITLLEALHEETPDSDANWIVEQISHLHLRIVRMLSDAAQRTTIEKERREWVSYHIVDDALRKDDDPRTAYELMLGEFKRLGAEAVELYLLPEPVMFMGSRTVALSDTLEPIGMLENGEIKVTMDEAPILFQDLLDINLSEGAASGTVTVGGLMAGNELMGIAVLRPGALSINAQMMSFVHTGSALKHLRTLATERELNRILNKNNLLLEHDSQHDEMTGLLNRRGFFNHLEIVLPLRSDNQGAIMYLDLDGLKGINDTFGHDAGDDAIRATACLLRSAIAERGLVCRMGGDEFCAFVFGDEQTISGVVDDITETMRAFNETAGLPYRLEISVGTAPCTIGELDSLDIAGLMSEADGALYRMKRKKKGLI